MPQPLDDVELERAVAELPEWRLQDGKLVREWKFADFSHAFAFLARVAVPRWTFCSRAPVTQRAVVGEIAWGRAAGSPT